MLLLYHFLLSVLGKSILFIAMVVVSIGHQCVISKI